MENKLVYTIQKKKMLPAEFVDIYKKAGENEKNFAWKAAEVMYATVHHESFVDAFETIEEYAEAIAVNKSTVSRKIRAVETRLELFNEYGDKYMFLSLECVVELLPLVKDDNLLNFMEECNITDGMNRDQIREMVKKYRDALRVEEPIKESGEEPIEKSKDAFEPLKVGDISFFEITIYGSGGERTFSVHDDHYKTILMNTLRSFNFKV